MIESQFSNISALSSPGSIKRHNEDIAITEDRLLVVIDGATGLGRNLISRTSSDAYWFVQEIKQEIRKKRLVCATFRTLMECVMRAVTQKYFLRLGRKIPNLDTIEKYEKPSASMVALSLEQGRVYAYRMGDCDLLWKHQGQVARLFDDSPLTDLDRRSVDAYVQARREGCRFDEAREAIQPMLVAHRNRLNVPGGYNALTVHVDCTKHMEVREIDGHPGDAFLLCSDGVSPAYGSYNALSLGDMFHYEPRDTLAAVRAVEQSDVAMARYPRLKVSDDATLIQAMLV